MKIGFIILISILLVIPTMVFAEDMIEIIDSFTVTQITNSRYPQMNPQVSGNYVVWADCRNGGLEGKNGVCENWDIYLYNIETGKEEPIAFDSDFQEYRPKIYNKNIVYFKGDGSGENASIIYYNIDSKISKTIAGPIPGFVDLQIFDNNVVFTRYSDSYLFNLGNFESKRIHGNLNCQPSDFFSKGHHYNDPNFLRVFDDMVIIDCNNFIYDIRNEKFIDIHPSTGKIINIEKEKIFFFEENKIKVYDYKKDLITYLNISTSASTVNLLSNNVLVRINGRFDVMDLYSKKEYILSGACGPHSIAFDGKTIVWHTCGEQYPNKLLTHYSDIFMAQLRFKTITEEELEQMKGGEGGEVKKEPEEGISTEIKEKTPEEEPKIEKNITLTCGNGKIDSGEDCINCALDFQCEARGFHCAPHGDCEECITSDHCKGKESFSGDYFCSGNIRMERGRSLSGVCEDFKCSGGHDITREVEDCENRFCQDGHCGCSEGYEACRASGRCEKIGIIKEGEPCSCDFQCDSRYCDPSRVCMKAIDIAFSSEKEIVKVDEQIKVTVSADNTLNQDIPTKITLNLGTGARMSGVLAGKDCSGNQCTGVITLPAKSREDITVEITGEGASEIELVATVTATIGGKQYQKTKKMILRAINCGDRECTIGETTENCCLDCGCPSGTRYETYSCGENKCVKNLKIDAVIDMISSVIVIIAIIFIVGFIVSKRTKGKGEVEKEIPESKMKSCPKCGKEIKKEWTFHKECGWKKIKKKKNKEKELKE